MKNILIKYGIYGVMGLAVLYPLLVRLGNTTWAPGQSITALLFPFFGLLMTSLLWSHAMSGVFEEWLRRYIDFDWFIKATAMIILWCLVLHPLLLLVSLSFSLGNVYAYYGTIFIWVGIVSWLLLISYDVTKPLKKYDFFMRHWNYILVISNLGFLLSFFHALKLGTDLQSGPLRYVWIFYGITASVAILYTYAVKPFLRK